MKKCLFVFAFTLWLTGFSVIAFTVDAAPPNFPGGIPKWLPACGYWVVESNLHMPRHTIVYCYNNDHTLVYKETIDGMVISLNKRRTKMRLKKIVEQTVLAYNQEHHSAENQMLVMHLIKK